MVTSLYASLVGISKVGYLSFMPPWWVSLGCVIPPFMPPCVYLRVYLPGCTYQGVSQGEPSWGERRLLRRVVPVPLSRTAAPRQPCTLFPFHCWSITLHPCVSRLSGQKGPLLGPGPPSSHYPFHCWSTFRRCRILNILNIMRNQGLYRGYTSPS